MLNGLYLAKYLLLKTKTKDHKMLFLEIFLILRCMFEIIFYYRFYHESDHTRLYNILEFLGVICIYTNNFVLSFNIYYYLITGNKALEQKVKCFTQLKLMLKFSNSANLGCQETDTKFLPTINFLD
jgi:hypothetical protein